MLIHFLAEIQFGKIIKRFAELDMTNSENINELNLLLNVLELSIIK